MAFKNIAMAWFLAILAVCASWGISSLIRKYPIQIPARKFAFFGSVAVIGWLGVCLVRTLLDGEKHNVVNLLIMSGIVYFLTIPFILFLGETPIHKLFAGIGEPKS